MGGNSVSGLSTAFPFPGGDEAVSRTQALLLMEGEEAARLAKKPIITVWAEENGALVDRAHEWSFGNGSAGAGHRHCGYTMLAPGRVLRMAVATAPDSAVVVYIVVNGTANAAYGLVKDEGRYSSTTTFGTPLELDQGDRVNFRSALTNPDVTSAVVSLLIELDM